MAQKNAPCSVRRRWNLVGYSAEYIYGGASGIVFFCL